MAWHGMAWKVPILFPSYGAMLCDARFYLCHAKAALMGKLAFTESARMRESAKQAYDVKMLVRYEIRFLKTLFAEDSLCAQLPRLGYARLKQVQKIRHDRKTDGSA